LIRKFNLLLRIFIAFIGAAICAESAEVLAFGSIALATQSIAIYSESSEASEKPSFVYGASCLPSGKVAPFSYIKNGMVFLS